MWRANIKCIVKAILKASKTHVANFVIVAVRAGEGATEAGRRLDTW